LTARPSSLCSRQPVVLANKTEGDITVNLAAAQRGPRGITQGSCSLSVYEGTPIFTGSVTMDQLPK